MSWSTTSPGEWASERHQTAIGRGNLSYPARQAITDGLFEQTSHILDFGCGRGQDVERMRSAGYGIQGWDPHYFPDTVRAPAEAVLLAYVLNVIEDPIERRATLQEAWSLTNSVLVVAARLTWDSSKVVGLEQNDGVRTSRGTFQHLFHPKELREFVEEATQARCVAASPGIVYAFRNDESRLRYLARRITPEFAWGNISEYSALLDSYIRFFESRGRAPSLEELPEDLMSTIEQVGIKRLESATRRASNQNVVAQAAKKSTLNVLLYLGTEIFNGRSRLGDLPVGLRADIRKFFRSYKEATARADRLLLKLRDSSYVRSAMRGSVGKMTPSALYVHKRALSKIPVVLQLYEHCGAIAAGRPTNFDVLKLHHDQHAVSWLGYKDFDKDPHPKLDWAYLVSFPDLETRFTDYSTRSNRPLLHRKEEFISTDDANYEKFSRLTRAEIRRGLYENPSRIGTEEGWESELQRCGVRLSGHRVLTQRKTKN